MRAARRGTPRCATARVALLAAWALPALLAPPRRAAAQADDYDYDYAPQGECVTRVDASAAYEADGEGGASVAAYVRLTVPEGCHVYGPRDCSASLDAPQCYSYTEARVGGALVGLSGQNATLPEPREVEQVETRFFSYNATKYLGVVVGTLRGHVADASALDVLANGSLPLEVALSSCSKDVCWHQYLLDTPGVPALGVAAPLERVDSLVVWAAAVPRSNQTAAPAGGEGGGGLRGGGESCARSADVGQVLAQPAVLGTVLAILLLLALSMWGLFDLAVPKSILDRLVPPPPEEDSVKVAAGGGDEEAVGTGEQAAEKQSRQSTGGVSPGGSFVRGLTFGLVVSPCVGPFAASVLVYVATSRDYVVGTVGLFLFGLGLSTLLLAAALASGLATRLPPPGKWLDRLKTHCGFIVLVTAAYFLSNLGDSQLTFVAMAVAFGAWALFIAASALYERIRLDEVPLDELLAFEARRPRKWQRKLPAFRRRELTARGASMHALLLAVCVVAFFFVWSFAVTGTPFSEPPASLLRPPPSAIDWVAEPQTAAAAAAILGRGLFVDFYADWCQNCRLADYTLLRDAGVVAALDESFVSVKCDATESGSVCATLKDEIWGAGGMPAYVIVRRSVVADAEGVLELLPREKVLNGKVSAATLVGALERAAAGLEPEGAEDNGCVGTSTSATERAVTIALCYPWGVLSSLSPCCYPLVPTTLAMFAGSGGKVGKLGVAARALSFALGIALSYAVLGLIVSFVL